MECFFREHEVLLCRSSAGGKKFVQSRCRRAAVALPTRKILTIGIFYQGGDETALNSSIWAEYSVIRIYGPSQIQLPTSRGPQTSKMVEKQAKRSTHIKRQKPQIMKLIMKWTSSAQFGQCIHVSAFPVPHRHD